jgi:16S rRNA (guanine527-N7)-methyltransferase
MFTEQVAKWGIALQSEQIAAFATYADELMRWNERINLTAITQLDEIYKRHFLDSLSCLPFLGSAPRRLIDIGSGAGFPGLPLKIVLPELQLTLLESVAKKAVFLEHIAATLDLRDVVVLPLRAEEAGRDVRLRGQADVVTARAVAETRVLIEYALPLLRIGGLLVAHKGAIALDEVRSAGKALASLGAELVGIEQVHLPGLDDRRIVIVRKVSPTSERYPRPPGIPSKRPL